MTIEEIALELELAGLSREQQIKLISSIKRGGFDAKAVDKKLIQMGFTPIFTIYDDEEDENKKD
ncbi:MAG: hypothetical protein M1300_00440 [Epsilonproteobacteria bacterium]|nr:hypothetical protein [Campylobacterota bacterium]